MGWCSEFGVQIAECDHPMVAGADACHCDVCGTLCEGRFDGCPDVWARGPIHVNFVRQPASRAERYGARSNGSSAETSRPADAESEPASPQYSANGMGEVLQSLSRLEDRLNTLESSVLDGQSAVAQSEVAELLEKLPRRLGEEIRSALDSREDARIERLDGAIARLLEAVVALDVSANRGRSDEPAPKPRRRSRAAG